MHAVFINAPQESALTPALSRRERGHRHRAFSLTELLVVIGIIVLLVGLLLVALGKVQEKARRTRTEAVMRGFANACTAFQADHDGKLPGVIPDEVLLTYPDGNGYPQISSTENALLDLMGGCRVLSPFDPAGGQVATDYANFFSSADNVNTFEFTFGADWKLKVDKTKIGEGPVINGKPHAPYFAPGANELVPVSGQLGDTVDASGNIVPGLPDLVDGWGQPVIYVRRVRERGPLRTDAASPTVLPQFLLGGTASYLGWPTNMTGDSVSGSLLIGEMQAEQIHSASPLGSIMTANTAEQCNQTFAFLVRHSGVSPKANNATELLYGSPRGSMALISAGPDGIYFSAGDGPGSTSAPVSDLTTGTYTSNPRVVEEYDDVLMFAGG